MINHARLQKERRQRPRNPKSFKTKRTKAKAMIVPPLKGSQQSQRNGPQHQLLPLHPVLM